MNQLFLLFSGWDVCRKINSYNGLRGLLITYYLRESLCRREEVLSAPRISLFWKRSFVSLRFLDVFSVGGGLCLFVLGLVCFAYRRHPAFCISPVLLQTENSWPTTKRFDDRQSLERARHGLKKRKYMPRSTHKGWVVWALCLTRFWMFLDRSFALSGSSSTRLSYDIESSSD